MRLGHAVLAITLLIGAGGSARAQSDFVGVRAMGMGEAIRTSATGASGPLVNPAGMSLVRQYVIEGQYGFRVEDLGHHAHVSVVDSITTRVAASLFYTFIDTSPRVSYNWAGGLVLDGQLKRQGHAAGLALSIPLGDRFILGATIKYLNFNTTAPLPAGTVPNQLTLDQVNGVTFDVGLLVRLGDKFRIAVTGMNLWDHGSRESPLSLGMGIGVIPIPSLTIAFDALVNFTGYQNYEFDPMTGRVARDGRVTGRFGPGVEWLIKGMVPLRLGVVYDSGLPATFLSVGIGYVQSKFGIDLAYRAKVQGGVENALMLGIRLFVD
jgi:hypothetical protein